MLASRSWISKVLNSCVGNSTRGKTPQSVDQYDEIVQTVWQPSGCHEYVPWYAQQWSEGISELYTKLLSHSIVRYLILFRPMKGPGLFSCQPVLARQLWTKPRRSTTNLWRIMRPWTLPWKQHYLICLVHVEELKKLRKFFNHYQSKDQNLIAKIIIFILFSVLLYLKIYA